MSLVGVVECDTFSFSFFLLFHQDFLIDETRNVKKSENSSCQLRPPFPERCNQSHSNQPNVLILDTRASTLARKCESQMRVFLACFSGFPLQAITDGKSVILGKQYSKYFPFRINGRFFLLMGRKRGERKKKNKSFTDATFQKINSNEGLWRATERRWHRVCMENFITIRYEYFIIHRTMER